MAADPKNASSLVEFVADAVVSVDLEGCVRTWSRGAERMYGWTAEEAVGRPLDELLGTGSARRNVEAALNLAPGDVIEFEGPGRRKDGTPIWVHVQVQVLRDADGQGFEVLGVTRDVTALRQAQDEERAADRRALDRARLVSLDGRMHDIEIVKRPDGTIVHGNDRALREYGYTREEFETLNVRDLREESTRANLADQLAAAATDGARYETVHRRKDGSVFPVEASVRWFEVDGERYLHGLIRDLTEQRHLEAARRASEQRLASTFAAMAEGVVVIDASGTIVDCNPAAERILGLTRAQMEGRSSVDPRWQTVHDDGSPFLGDTYPTMVALRTGAPQRDVIMGVSLPDGSQHWISISSEPLRATPGKLPYAVVTTFSDITALRREREAVRNSERKLAAVLDGSDDGFYECLMPGLHVEYSPAMVRMVGADPETIKPDANFWYERVHPDDRPLLERTLEELAALRVAKADLTYRVRHANGAWRWVRARCSAMSDGAGHVRIAGTVRDITELKERGQRLEALLEANMALIEELRGALTHVRTLSGLLPICTHCKKIRDDAGYWKQVEEYIGSRTAAQFSHGLCPECRAAHYAFDGVPPVPGTV